MAFGLDNSAVSSVAPRRVPTPQPTNNAHDIKFPRFFEGAWASAGQTDLERAKVFLWNYGGPNPAINSELRAIASNPSHQDVSSLAAAVQRQVFGNRHASFSATPLLQWMRFILMKTKEIGPSGKTKQVRDFFFDPTLAPTLENLREDTVSYKYPAAPLKVAVIGGGPTGLATAIALAEKASGKIEVHIYEGRWAKVQPGSFVDFPQGARRRDQVVTLQHSVTDLMSKETRDALFLGYPEVVWPDSANLQIRKVEDRLLRRAQDAQFRGTIFLHSQAVTREELHTIGDYHLLIGADGAGSWIRQTYFQNEEQERGRSYALGVAFNRPEGLPRSQPINIFLTVGQTRYLLNASDTDGTGFLNMQLTQEEWDQMLCVDGQPCTFGRPSCLRQGGRVPAGFDEGQVFAPSENRESPLWRAIIDGLKLFGFKETEVTSIMRIPIIVRGIKNAVSELRLTENPSMHRPHGLVTLAGDAAMTVHFWPGRGANSGMKSGIALADEIVFALKTGQFVGLNRSALAPYTEFLKQLQPREHDSRSMPIINQSGDPKLMGWLMNNAKLVPYNAAMGWLVSSIVQTAERLQSRSDWPLAKVDNIESHLRYVLGNLSPATVQEMAVSFPWPTRQMAGAEVLPRCFMMQQAAQQQPKPTRGRNKEKAKVKKDDKKKRAQSMGPVSSPPPSGLTATTSRDGSKFLSTLLSALRI